MISQRHERTYPKQDILINALSASTEINVSQINLTKATVMTNDFNENFITTSSSIPQRNDSKLTQTQDRFK